MSALAKIKKTATQYEQDRQYDKALAEYARLLDGGAGSDEDVDVTLYNRAGDLALRAGDVPRAVTYFERAIDLYAAGGFLNNAVALAVKILRHAPGHLAAHHTLGVLYGRKGFLAEARQHLADYAAQMHRANRADEVRRTLAELAALGTGPEEIASVRELLTARAGAPDAGGALVRAFDDALGPSAHTIRAGAEATVPVSATALPLSELIEFEVRGPRFAPIAADVAATAVRWTTALPGDPPPLRLSAMHVATPSADIDVLDFGTEERDVVDAPELGLPTFELPSIDFAFDVPGDVSGDANDRDDACVHDDDAESDAVNGVMLWVPNLDAAAPETAVALPFPDEIVATPSDLESPEAFTEEAFTDLGEWLRSTDVPSSTRLVTPLSHETGDEHADFDAALHAFTAGIAQSVDAGDRESHYDLGVAFREMGLLTDAVREFQRALAAPGSGLREREALAQCFLDLGRPELALATLEQAAAAALASGAASDMLLGVHYVLAESARVVGRVTDARAWYVRVLASDYGFRDAAARLAALPPDPPPTP